MRVLLEAPILTKSGYGEHARLVYRSIIKEPGLDIHISPLQWGITSWENPEGTIKRDIIRHQQYIAHCKQNNKNPEYDLQIHVGIPNEFEKKGKRSICVTAGIETDRVSPKWLIKTHQGIDKIIVPSNHAKDGFINTKYELLNKTNNSKTIVDCNCEVDVVPYPVKVIEPKHLDLNITTDYNFLTIAMLGPRKNLENTISCFVDTFKDNPDVGLLLKVSSGKSSIIDRDKTKQQIKMFLEKLEPRKCKIYLLHGDLTEEEIHSLYVHPKIKAYISTTHGEGYGLPLFEAAYSGLPIIATDWSGHLDFLSAEIKGKSKKLFAKVDYKLSEVQKSAEWEDIITKDSKWAFPNEKSIKNQLTNMYKNYGMYKSWAKKLKQSILISHDEKVVVNKMKKSILLENSEQTVNEIEEMFSSLGE